MTIITEYRWKCDYDKCGAVSPPIQLGEHPLGWVEIAYAKNISGFVVYSESLNNIVHFCCENHRQQWEALRHD